MTGQVVGGLGHDDHVDEVVEQLQEADRSVLHDVAVRPGRSPEPALEAGQCVLGLGWLGLWRHRLLVEVMGRAALQYREVDKASRAPRSAADREDDPEPLVA